MVTNRKELVKKDITVKIFTLDIGWDSLLSFPWNKLNQWQKWVEYHSMWCFLCLSFSCSIFLTIYLFYDCANHFGGLSLLNIDYFFIVSIQFNLYNPSFVFLGGAGFYIIIEFQTMFSLLISFFWVCLCSSGCLMDPILPSFQNF